MHIFSLQFPYDPDYGDGQSLSSRSAADQLVHEVSEEGSLTVLLSHTNYHLYLQKISWSAVGCIIDGW